MLDFKKLDLKSIELEDINTNDYPDFVDAFISYAQYNDGTELTDQELDELNNDSSFVYDQVINKVF
jgi:hypothetical protein